MVEGLESSVWGVGFRARSGSVCILVPGGLGLRAIIFLFRAITA